MKKIATIICTSITLSACGGDADVPQQVQGYLTKLSECFEGSSKEIANLQEQIKTLETERDQLLIKVEELSLTAPNLLEKISTLVVDGDLSEAQHELRKLQTRFPRSAELNQAKALVANLKRDTEAKEKEKKRLEALGFKALSASGSFDNGVIKTVIGKPSISKKFVSDRYDGRYHYSDPDREHSFVIATMSVTAATGINNPLLPGVALYWADGKDLRRLAEFEIRLARWESYGSYLGNYSDTNNDFAKTATVQFSLGAQVSNDDLKKRPLYIVATRNGCIQRNYERFSRPPISYSGNCADLPRTLQLRDFSEENPIVTLMRRID